MTTTDDPDKLRQHIEQDNRQQRKGWECPRCHKVHAPWVDACDCKPERDSASVGPSEFK